MPIDIYIFFTVKFFSHCLIPSSFSVLIQGFSMYYFHLSLLSHHFHDILIYIFHYIPFLPHSLNTQHRLVLNSLSIHFAHPFGFQAKKPIFDSEPCNYFY